MCREFFPLTVEQDAADAEPSRTDRDSWTVEPHAYEIANCTLDHAGGNVEVALAEFVVAHVFTCFARWPMTSNNFSRLPLLPGPGFGSAA